MSNSSEHKNIVDLKKHINQIELFQVIEDVIKKIYGSNCGLMISNSMTDSKHHSIPVECNGNCYIVLGTNKSDSLHILWDLLHEFGHHLDSKLTQGIKDNSGIQKNREKSAWQLADKEFLKYPELKNYEYMYTEYRTSCLSSYKVFDYEGYI